MIELPAGLCDVNDAILGNIRAGYIREAILLPYWVAIAQRSQTALSSSLSVVVFLAEKEIGHQSFPMGIIRAGYADYMF